MPLIKCVTCKKKKSHQAHGMCKPCHGKWYRSNHPELDAKNWDRMRQDPRKNILKGARKRAKQRGKPFTLTLDDIVIPSMCPVLGIPLKPEVGSPATVCSPSLDEIVAGAGYTLGNVQVISRLANTMKSNATPEQLLSFADWIYATYSKNISKRGSGRSKK
jgi:hypothetical protein